MFSVLIGTVSSDVFSVGKQTFHLRYYFKMAHHQGLQDPSSLSLIYSSSDEEEEVVERPISPEVPVQPKLIWTEGDAAYVYD